MTTEDKFKVGDQVLVEAEYRGREGSMGELVHIQGSLIRSAFLQTHPFPDPTTPRLIPVDLDGEPGEYPPIKPSEMRVGDVVRESHAEKVGGICVIATGNKGAWIAPNQRAANFWEDMAMAGRRWHWLLIQRDGQDQRQAKRLRWCDLPVGEYRFVHANGRRGYNSGQTGSFISDSEIPPGTRVWRIEFPESTEGAK